MLCALYAASDSLRVRVLRCTAQSAQIDPMRAWDVCMCVCAYGLDFGFGFPLGHSRRASTRTALAISESTVSCLARPALSSQSCILQIASQDAADVPLPPGPLSLACACFRLGIDSVA